MIRSDDIKKAALQLFAFRGYDATSMQDIADAVGIKKATIYSHFKSKSDIFLALLQEQADLFTNTITAALAKSGATEIKDLLYEVFDANVRLYNDKTNLLFWKRAELLAAGFSEMDIQIQLKLIMDNMNSLVQMNVQKAFMEKGMEPDSRWVGKCMLSFMLFLHGYLEWMMLSETYEAMDTRAAWENFWNGLG